MIVAILQARCSSSRLPGKVLMPILGRPMLARQIERLGRAQRIDKLVVATSTEADDDAIEGLCAELGIACFRGALDDVLDRFHGAAMAFGADHILRLTGDCPLCDPGLIDRLIEFHLDRGADYSSTALKPSFADGLDAEIMTFDALDAAWREARLGSEREHVTPFIYTRPERFKLAGLTSPVDRSALRWTVDTAEDFALVARVYEALYPISPAFTSDDILAYLERHPEVTALNAGLTRNEGYVHSRLADVSGRRA